LKDSLPTPQWKNEIWKDGIANIDEHLNGFISWTVRGKCKTGNILIKASFTIEKPVL
jgi:hypothetical protein